MFRTTASRLSAALLGYVTLIILLLTLNPFYVSLPEQLHISFYSTRTDFILNLLLFVPFGFLFRLTGGGRRGAIFAGAAISFGIEAMQIFLPARVPSVADFLSNALGAASGVAIYDLIAARIAITAGTVGRLRLETPLMGSIYLMMPLLWTSALASRASPDRWALTALIGVCGAIMFSELYRSYSEAAGLRPIVYAALTTGAWFMLGSGPALLHPSPILSIGTGVALLSAALTAVPRRSTERRFERVTLQRVLPAFAFYVLLAALWHPLQPLGSWHGMFGFTLRHADTSLQGLYPRSESLAAFAVLGYLAAEWRSRDELTLRRDLSRLFAVGAVSAISLETLAGFQAGSGASFIRGTMAILSALFGGTVYHLLRAHVRFLLDSSGERKG